MTAGRGIVHSERTPSAARKTGPTVHGLQIWVALPAAFEEIEPLFRHYPAADVPIVEKQGARLSMVAGSAFGVTSPVQTLSPLFHVIAQLEERAAVGLPEEHAGRAAYVVEGAIAADGATCRAGSMLVFREKVPASVVALEPSRVLLLGGAPLEGERHIYWTFVSSSKERIERAKRDWKERRLPLVRGDENEFGPLPSF
jgi:redox-sensitive bicupin YhaK (pirin superfamily)